MIIMSISLMIDNALCCLFGVMGYSHGTFMGGRWHVKLQNLNESVRG